MSRSIFIRRAALATMSAASLFTSAARAADSVTIVPGSLTQGTVKSSLTGGAYANEADNLGDWPLNTGGSASKTFAISFENPDFNGSAFGGISANTPFYNIMLAIAMWFGRFGVIVPVLAIAGSMAAKKRIAATEGTMPTHGPLFISLLIGVVLLVGLLNYVPALALGPVIEHLVLWK